MKRFIFNVLIGIAICLSSLSINIYAQTLSQIEALTTSDNLPFRDVTAVTQDDLGYLWFATTQGLTRFDGYEFKVYNNDPNNPNFLEKENFTNHNLIFIEPNLLWFCANNQLFNLNVTTDSIIGFTDSHNIKGDVVDLHVDAKDQIWIITEDHWISNNDTTYQYLQRYDKNLDIFNVVDKVRRGPREYTRITSDVKNNLWWSTMTSGTIEYNDDGQKKAVYILDNSAQYEEATYSNIAFFDSENKHDYFPNEGGIDLYDKFNQERREILDISQSFFHGLQDDERNIWFAGDSILYRMNRKGKFNNVTGLLQKTLGFTSISQIFIDREGLLWITTDNGILKIRIKPSMFQQLFKSDEEDWGHSMRSIFETKDGHLIAMYERDKELIEFDGDGQFLGKMNLWGNYPETINPLYGARFFAMDKHGDYVYTVNENLVKIDLKTGETELYNEYSPYVNVTGPNPLIKLKDGRLLFGYSLQKLIIYDPESGHGELVFKDPNQINYLNFRYFLEGNEPGIIWIGTLDNGLLKVNLNGTVEAHYHLNSEPALSKNNIIVIHEDNDGSLWLGSFGSGLIHLKLSTKEAITYDTSTGISNNNVVGILPYKEDYLLVSTYNGLSLFNKETQRFQNFFVEDGLTHNEFNYTSFFKDSQGYYYFGGMNGINRFKPKDLLGETQLPPLKMTSLTRFNSKNNVEEQMDFAYQNFEAIPISPYNQYFQVNWTTPNYFNNGDNRYYTKLEGYDSDWISQGNRNFVRYNKLPAGDYILNVKGNNFSGAETSEILQIPITVHPIFYKTWWFIALVVVIILLIIYGIFQLRMKQLLALEQLRTKISTDLHDDLGSMLSGLAMQSELLEINARHEDKSKLRKITKISRDAISQMRDLVWSIDNRRDQLSDLIARMEELAEELLFPLEITFHIDKGSVNLNKKLPAIAKQHMYFIFKEAITNIIKHSNARHVSIILGNDHNSSLVIIKNDGVVKKQSKTNGFGLANMALRAKKMNAEIDFIKDDTFEIHLKMPFSLQ